MSATLEQRMQAASSRPLTPRRTMAYARRPLHPIELPDARAAGDLADWLLWLQLSAAAPTTRYGYARTCRDLLLAHPEVAFGEFTDRELMELLLTYPEKSRRVRKAHLSSWFGWGYNQRRIPDDPTRWLPKIRQPHQPVHDVFPVGDEHALRALPSPDGPLMTLLFEAGLRKSEARHLTAKRIDFDHARIIVAEGAKGSRERVVPMMTELYQALNDLVFIEALEPDDHLWYDKPGGPFGVRLRRSKPIAESAFHRWWGRCVEQAGVAYRNPHMARHTFATRWRERGLGLDDIQKLLGHASVSTTINTYVHSDVSMIGGRMRNLIQETT